MFILNIDHQVMIVMMVLNVEKRPLEEAAGNRASFAPREAAYHFSHQATQGNTIIT